MGKKPCPHGIECVSERGPTLQDVLDAVSELRGELGEVRIGLGDVRGRIDRIDGAVAEQGHRLDTLTSEVTEQGRRLDGAHRRNAGAHRATCASRGGGTDGIRTLVLRCRSSALQVEVAELKADVATLKRASGE